MHVSLCPRPEFIQHRAHLILASLMPMCVRERERKKRVLWMTAERRIHINKVELMDSAQYD